ncbi:flagellar motor protein MotB [Salinisphaera orenii MK-B5]|uniref:Flagellar motor protein MotB n=2 Tax=Salinisphaera orenii TaxID=856731 RepID=A0A423PTX3_9GAMM|nr:MULTISPECIES: OmpA family protein [Salinisphaera]ROO29049.1 flagellar motor protein MotB [Salinisphaera orenii MK-B5]ROO37467.1 flagellar motor protein MotB [Salinisphaera halophila YIM 95161]
MTVKHSTKVLLAVLCTALFVTACAGDPNRKTKIGAGVGAVLGGLTGSQLGDESGTNVAIGAALGALAGGATGRYMDNQQQELNEKLAAEQARDVLDITRLDSDALKIGVASDASFAVDSSTLSQNAQSTFNKIANVLKDYEKTAIHVVGHTDSTGSEQHNLELSQKRAQSVAGFLTGRGVDSQRVLTWGRGESEPIASNDTEAGRAENRRVDIVIKPIVEGQEKQAFSEPPNLGS